MTREEFRSARQSLGLTQQRWAEWLGLSHAHVRRIETTGEVSPVLARLVDAIRQGYRPSG
jgi:predicted transcriptional regulator